MGNAARHWQATIQYGEDADVRQSVIVYGQSLAALREAAHNWFEANKPLFFRRGRVTYFSSDGTYPAPTQRRNRDQDREQKSLKQGWYREDYPRGGYSSPYGKSFQDNRDAAIAEFIQKHLLPEKGPEYQETVILDGSFQFHLIKTVLCKEDTTVVNELIRRGWYLMGMQENHFVLGHPEENAFYYDITSGFDNIPSTDPDAGI